MAEGRPLARVKEIIEDPDLDLSKEERADLALFGFEETVRDNLRQQSGGEEPSEDEVEQNTAHGLLLLFKLCKELERTGKLPKLPESE